MRATPPSTPKPRRRWLQFSLRTKLVVASLLVGSGSGVLLGTMLYAPTARWWTRSHGEHLTLAEASGRVRLDLPDSASDRCPATRWQSRLPIVPKSLLHLLPSRWGDGFLNPWMAKWAL